MVKSLSSVAQISNTSNCPIFIASERSESLIFQSAYKEKEEAKKVRAFQRSQGILLLPLPFPDILSIVQSLKGSGQKFGGTSDEVARMLLLLIST